MQSESIEVQKIEEEIKTLLSTAADNEQFLTQLRGKLISRYPLPEEKRSFWLFQPAMLAGLLAFLALVVILIAGPRNVYASFMKLFGYVPGYGIVENSAGIRVLEQPVSLTRDGIILSVNGAVLTASETRLDYGFAGVPRAAYPASESDPGCLEQPYFLTADGSRIEITSPVPADISRVLFVAPCVPGAVPGAAPVDWALELRFIPAPADFKILAVEDVPTPTAAREDDLQQPGAEAGTADEPQGQVSIEKFIQNDGKVILLGCLKPQLKEGETYQISGPAKIIDADGNNISYSYASDAQIPPDWSTVPVEGDQFAYEFSFNGVQMPVKIVVSGYTIQDVDPAATATLIVNVGENPQPGETLEINREVEISGHKFRLVSITPDSRNGYKFLLDLGENLSSVSVRIDGYNAMGGGGGGSPENPERFQTSLSFEQLPTGELKLIFGRPMKKGQNFTWTGIWDAELEKYVEAAPLLEPCLNADKMALVPAVPAEMSGMIVYRQYQPEPQMILTNLDGTGQQVLSSGYGGVALSSGGTLLASVTNDGVSFFNIETGESSLNANLPDLKIWSPDDTQVAYIAWWEAVSGIVIANSDGGNPQQLTNLGYEFLAGWSPDGKLIYFAIPGYSADGFLLRSVEVESGEVRDVMVLSGSSLKDPRPRISPDGSRIAYRGIQNNSLYLKKLDGSQAQLLVDEVGWAISGVTWSADGKKIAISVLEESGKPAEIFIIDTTGCQVQRVSAVQGDIEAIILP